MAVRYYFRDDRAPFVVNRDKANPQVIGAELARIKKVHGDTQPDTVWRQAQNPRNPLHQHFPWDERKAAEAHWRSVARELIGCIEITSLRQKERAPMSVSITQANGRKYYESIEVLDSRQLQLALWQDALRDLDAFLKHFERLRKLCQAVSPSRKVIEAEIARLKGSLGKAA
jgi:hypothetical protein